MAEIPTGEWIDPPVLPRTPDELPGELLRGADIPPDLDPFADGILMRHQTAWLEDDSDLKLAEKGRRTGLTFAEALDDTLIAAAARSAGGDNVFYIGDTKDKGREFIGYVAHFAKMVAKELVSVEEFLFEDVREDGSSAGMISAFRVRFASGFRIEALSSRPENIRGLQGIVVIDEAAFHKDIRALLDAVSALLIWGGKVRIISTHYGYLNPFNELIREVRATGKPPYSIHTITFQDAVDNGLYRRRCLVRGEDYDPQAEAAWVKKIRDAYGVRTAKMRQELDAVPAEAEGAALTRVQIEAVMKPIPILRWHCDDDFKNAPAHVRTADARDWCDKHLRPLLEKLNDRRPHVLGGDFARTGDASVFMPMEIGVDLVRRAVFQLELRNVPFDQQREILFYICDRLPRFTGAALDATGNGAYLAEVAAQRYGSTVVEVKFTVEWYRINMPAYVEAFADGTIELARHEDVLRDHQALQYVGGIIKVPDDHRFKGEDGFDRHGDSAIAGCLAFFASRADLEEYGYTRVGEEPDGRVDMFERPKSGGFAPTLRGGLF